MKRLAPIILIAFAACSGGGNANGGGSTGPKPVASVSVTAATTQISVGQQLALNFIALDASGAALTGRTVAWTSSNNLVATVTTTGIVSGVSPGTATITATVEGKVGSTVITVQAVQTACAGATPLSLSVGEVRLLTGTDRSAICLTGGTSASEYMLLAFNNSLDTTGQALGVKLDATNTAQAVGLPAAALVAPVVPGLTATPSARPVLTRDFDTALRDRERREFGPALRGGNRTAAYTRLRASRAAGGMVPGARSLIRGLAASPAVGDLVTLNTNAFSSCSSAQNSVGRVRAIGTSSIVVADTGAPAGGFTTADYQSFATTFDTLVYALDTTAFGAPSDMDNNGRIVIFFTQAVNKLTAAGANSVIGGFFYARDLFPVAGNQALGLQACPTSNEGEMFYVPVVDSASTYNGFFKTKSALLTDVIATLAHEFQHLINAGRRIYVNNADDFEATWLNEGLSHVAEELLFYRATRLNPKGNLTLSLISANDPGFTITNSYQVDNLGRYSSYLKAPDTSSPYADNDNLTTRGATWSFLRYAVDLGTSSQNTYFHALVNSQKDGMVNLSTVLGPVFAGGISVGLRSWAIANFIDDAGLTTNTQYQFLSWNFRNVLFNQLGNTGFPLQAKALLDKTSQSFTLPAGGAGYMRFRVNATIQATIVPSLLQPAVELILVRTQ